MKDEEEEGEGDEKEDDAVERGLGGAKGDYWLIDNDESRRKEAARGERRDIQKKNETHGKRDRVEEWRGGR